MNYKETVNYLYNCVPMFQKEGSTAYKEGLSTTRALDEHLGHPHTQFKTIHIGGTNGKGSTSHTLAAILQEAGYKVGLYTSPHLIDFRERIRVDGAPISEDFVVNFIAKHRAFYEPLYPSFFELTTAMAFDYFASQKIDVAVVEVGLGGRLDCTNIISPDLSIITNISNDHNQFLGNTLAEIASEKGGIIKPNTPVIIGEYVDETRPVFTQIVNQLKSPIYFAQDNPLISELESKEISNGWDYMTTPYGHLIGELGGLCQLMNSNTVLTAIPQLIEAGYKISAEDVRIGFSQVTKLTGLMGRWQELQSAPRMVCDTGHNVAGISTIVKQLSHQDYKRLHFVLGMVNDKDIRGVLALLPKDAIYYFTQASVQRAMPAQELAKLAGEQHLHGTIYPSVKEATLATLKEANPDDFIFIGGSSFIVADLLSFWFQE